MFFLKNVIDYYQINLTTRELHFMQNTDHMVELHKYQRWLHIAGMLSTSY